MAKRGRRKKKDVARFPNGKIKHEQALTPERRTHGTIELLARPIADDAGRPSNPYRAVDAWTEIGPAAVRSALGASFEAWTDEKTADHWKKMCAAGGDFRSRFAIAQLNPLKAGDPGRPVVNGRTQGGPGLRIEGARDAVWRAIMVVGGTASDAGSCLWQVIGWEMPMPQWALSRWMTKAESEVVLIAMLGKLEAYYGGSRR